MKIALQVSKAVIRTATHASFRVTEQDEEQQEEWQRDGRLDPAGTSDMDRLLSPKRRPTEPRAASVSSSPPSQHVVRSHGSTYECLVRATAKTPSRDFVMARFSAPSPILSQTYFVARASGATTPTNGANEGINTAPAAATPIVAVWP